MDSIMDLIKSQLTGNIVQNLSKKFGVDPKTIESAIDAILPNILGGLAKNTENKEGAESLNDALDKKHDGSILKDLLGFLMGGEGAIDGAKILSYIFGDKRGEVEQQVVASSGLTQAQSAELMDNLAPVVLGVVGEQKKAKQLTAKDLSDLLKAEKENLKKGNVKGILTAFLDTNKDGSFMDELWAMVQKFLAMILGGGNKQQKK